jgi:leader peptidase (prepilin peptidase)/N-methyltransferase
MTLILATLVFLLGTAIGSFLSVVIHRMRENKKGIFLSRSVCPHCNTKLKNRHLIPVISFLFLKGKCAYCKKTISKSYILIELITGFLFLLTFSKFNFLITESSNINYFLINYSIDWFIFEKFLIYTVLFSFLIAILFYDTLYQEIPDQFSLPAISIAIVNSILTGTPTITDMIIGAIVFFAFFGIQIILSKGQWVGGGDLRMGILIGALFGVKFGFMSLMLAYLIGAFISVILIILGKAGAKTKIAFAPFLISGILLTIFLGPEIYNLYLDKILY